MNLDTYVLGGLETSIYGSPQVILYVLVILNLNIFVITYRIYSTTI